MTHYILDREKLNEILLGHKTFISQKNAYLATVAGTERLMSKNSGNCMYKPEKNLAVA